MKDGTHKLVSLFSGAMGLDLGLEAAGFDICGAVEINSAAVRTIRKNRPSLSVIANSVHKIKAADILSEFSLRKGDVTVLSGGPCCQAFSTVGKRESLSDPRGTLFREYCRLVRELRPRFFVMENVRGILSAAVKHRPLNERGAGHPPLRKNELFGSALGLILKELAALRYHVVFGLLNAADYGVPQRRWRVFFIGSRDGEPIQLPSPTHRDPSSPCDGVPKWLTLRQALHGINSFNWVCTQ